MRTSSGDPTSRLSGVASFLGALAVSLLAACQSTSAADSDLGGDARDLSRPAEDALDLASSDLSLVDSAAADLYSPDAAARPALGGHGIGYDFIGTNKATLSTNPFTSVTGSVVLCSVGRGVLADFSTSMVSDNQGNGSYPQLGTAHAYTNYPTSGTALYARLAASGGAGHVVSATKPSTGDEVTVLAAEFRGVTTVVDSKWVEDLSSPNTSLSVTTTGPAVLAAFWWGDNSSGELNPAASSGWTVLDHTSSLASNHVQGASAYREVSAAGTYSIEWTPSTAQGAQLWVVALQ